MGMEVNLPIKALLWMQLADAILMSTKDFDSSSDAVGAVNMKAVICVQNTMDEITNLKEDGE